MQLFSVLIPLALASGALSSVLVRSAASSCAADNCARAVTGTAAKPAITQRQSDCASFQATPSAAVPTYASACSGSVRYSSACSCFGYTARTTAKTTASTTTKTTARTTTTSAPKSTSDCLSDSDATAIVNDFINLLTYTQKNFNTTLANQLLADDFTDSSDSIDYILEAPLGSVTFASKQAFIKGQGSQPPFPSVTTLNIFHTCQEITWRFQLNTTPLPVRGIDIFVTNSAKQIKTIFAEFNSGAFLFNLGRPECLANWTVSVQH